MLALIQSVQPCVNDWAAIVDNIMNGLAVIAFIIVMGVFWWKIAG